MALIYAPSLYNLLNENNFNTLHVFLFIYFLGSFALFLQYGIYSKTIPPQILFEVDGELSLYSQGFSAFYAYASIFFYVISFNKQKYFTGQGIITLSIAALFFSLSILGGARGDAIAGIIAITLYTLRTLSVSKIILITTLVYITFSYVLSSDLFQETIFAQRMVVVSEGSLGERDVLMFQSIDLLNQNIACGIFGCGFNYFQSYWNLPFGLYPHNIFIEATITFGLIGIILDILAIVGIISLYFSKAGRHPFFYIMIIEIIRLSKSGTLVSTTAIPVLVVLSAYGLSWLIKNAPLLHHRTKATPGKRSG